MKVIEMANAIVPIDNIVYASRSGDRIYLYLTHNHTISAKFRNASEAQIGLEELRQKIELATN